MHATLPEINLTQDSPAPSSHRRLYSTSGLSSGRLANKVNLSVIVPAQDMGSTDTPLVTPQPQTVYTPNAPPPLVLPNEANDENRARLGQIWAATSNDWNMTSPALIGAFPPQDQLASPSASVAATGDASPSHSQATRALNTLTAKAMADGTPTFPFFPDMDSLATHHVTSSPLHHLMPPASATRSNQGYTKRLEDDYFSQRQLSVPTSA